MGPSVFLRGSWRWAYFVPGLLLLMTSLGGVFSGDMRSVGGLITAAMFLVPGGWTVVTAPFAGVRADGEGLRYRGVLKRAFLPWSQIDSIDAFPLGSELATAETIVVRGQEGEEPLMLLMLTGFTRKRANNRVRAQILVMQQMRARALAD